MIDLVAGKGWLDTTIALIKVIAMTIQGLYHDDCSLLMLPNIKKKHIYDAFRPAGIHNIKQAVSSVESGRIFDIMDSLHSISQKGKRELITTLQRFPNLIIDAKIVSKATQFDGNIIQFTVEVSLRKRNSKSTLTESRAYAPRFPKIKNEGWFVIVALVDLCSDSSGKVLGLARAQFSNAKNLTLNCSIPRTFDYKFEIRIHALSDSYIGLDKDFVLELPPDFQIIRQEKTQNSLNESIYTSNLDDCGNNIEDSEEDDDLDFWLLT